MLGPSEIIQDSMRTSESWASLARMVTVEKTYCASTSSSRVCGRRRRALDRGPDGRDEECGLSSCAPTAGTARSGSNGASRLSGAAKVALNERPGRADTCDGSRPHDIAPSDSNDFYLPLEGGVPKTGLMNSVFTVAPPKRKPGLHGIIP